MCYCYFFFLLVFGFLLFVLSPFTSQLVFCLVFIHKIIYYALYINGEKTTADKIYGVLDSKDDKQLAKDDMQELRALHIQHLSKSYGNRQLFSHLNLDIQTG